MPIKIEGMKREKILPVKSLDTRTVQSSLNNILWDGVTTEVMTTLTGGVFLVSMALLMGANNKTIGLLAAWPLIGNLAQLTIVAFLQKYKNRKVITLVLLLVGRIPLLVIGIAILLNIARDINFLMTAMAMHYIFSAAAGLTWNSWVKDLVPENYLGKFFSKRSKYMLVVNLTSSISLAYIVDYLTAHRPDLELHMYALLFTLAGISGIIGILLLFNAKEPYLAADKISFDQLMKKPFQDLNFKKLLMFNSGWLFAVNVAAPFFVVFLLKDMGISMKYVILLTLVGQLFSIITVQFWGRLSDKYSNKNIILLLAPVYVITLFIWLYVGLIESSVLNTLLLIFIFAIMGVCNAGINLALTNIGLKLIPTKHATIYLSLRTIVTSLIAAMGPLAGGVLADVFEDYQFRLAFEWNSPALERNIKIVSLQGMNFLFIISAVACLMALQLLHGVKEKGEIEPDFLKLIMRKNLKNRLRQSFIVGNFQVITTNAKAIIRRKKRKGNRKRENILNKDFG